MPPFYPNRRSPCKRIGATISRMSDSPDLVKDLEAQFQQANAEFSAIAARMPVGTAVLAGAQPEPGDQEAYDAARARVMDILKQLDQARQASA